MDFEIAAALARSGIAPQDFEALAEENDLLSTEDGLLHDPEICLRAPDHLTAVLSHPVVWLPGYAPYGDLWTAVRVGAEASEVALCPLCYPDAK